MRLLLVSQQDHRTQGRLHRDRFDSHLRLPQCGPSAGGRRRTSQHRDEVCPPVVPGCCCLTSQVTRKGRSAGVWDAALSGSSRKAIWALPGSLSCGSYAICKSALRRDESTWTRGRGWSSGGRRFHAQGGRAMRGLRARVGPARTVGRAQELPFTNRSDQPCFILLAAVGGSRELVRSSRLTPC